MGPEVLGPITAALPAQQDERLLVGFDLADDAGVVRLDAERALVQTVDVLTPLVDDPATWGAIAAANALSDVYAMGGAPLSALHVVCWPEVLGPEVLQAVLRGSMEKVAEAGALVVGGHTVRDPEPKFGLAVTGLVHPDRIWRNAGARPGDVLVLTKALGTGIIATAAKRDACPPEVLDAAVAQMLALNSEARDAALALDVHACTDITGNGLIGHAWEMARASGVGLEIAAASLPLLPGLLDRVRAGHVTRGGRSNRAFVGAALAWEGVDPLLQDVLADPQTSGGLLLALPEADAARLPWPIVGRVRPGPAGLRITPSGSRRPPG